MSVAVLNMKSGTESFNYTAQLLLVECLSYNNNLRKYDTSLEGASAQRNEIFVMTKVGSLK